MDVKPSLIAAAPAPEDPYPVREVDCGCRVWFSPLYPIIFRACDRHEGRSVWNSSV